MKRPIHKIISIKELKQVINVIFRQHSEIQLAYIYGSYAQGSHTEFSDIDIGVILKENFKEPPLYFAELSSKIEKCFNYKINVDLRILNNATPRFLFQVIKSGIILYSQDNNFKDEYEIKVIHQYLDIKPMLDMFDNISIREVLKDGH